MPSYRYIFRSNRVNILIRKNFYLYNCDIEKISTFSSWISIATVESNACRALRERKAQWGFPWINLGFRSCSSGRIQSTSSYGIRNHSYLHILRKSRLLQRRTVVWCQNPKSPKRIPYSHHTSKRETKTSSTPSLPASTRQGAFVSSGDNPGYLLNSFYVGVHA